MASPAPAPAPCPAPRPRILLAGDPMGRLHLLFKRVTSLNQSTGPFDALFCVGQFFSANANANANDLELEEYVQGRAAVPIPTYFTGAYGASTAAASQLLSSAATLTGRAFKPDGIQICPNLYWLRGSAKFSLRGLSVVYLSGKASDQRATAYTLDDIDALRALADDPGVVDLFLTYPFLYSLSFTHVSACVGLTNGADTSDAPPQVTDPSGCDPLIAELVAQIKPRYHIAGTKNVFYAREPYTNEGAVHVTRFIGLATVGNKDKQRFIHAISPTPAASMSAADIGARPPNTTESPYRNMARAQNLDDTKESSRHNSIEHETQYWRYDAPNKRQKKGAQAQGRLLCFKFTSSASCPNSHKCKFTHDPEAREHYMRNVCFDFLNKGNCERGADCKFGHSLSDDSASVSRSTFSARRPESSCWFCLSSPDVESDLITSLGENYYCALAKGPLVQNHVLLVPIEHSPNTLIMTAEAEKELQMYKNALTKYFDKQEKVVIYFEYAFQHNRHANLQVVPIPASKACHVEKIFNLASDRLGFSFSALNPEGDSTNGRKELRSQFDGKSSMFYVELPGNKILVHSVEDNDKFPVQFGREVLAGLLGTPDRADWRKCKLPKEEEMEMVDAFKAGFSSFDPTTAQVNLGEENPMLNQKLF
ncbi:Zinc finger CCCH domain-containing protein 59 [Rhynchospora pubera]|uniref:Zinc finger CCCH domain-containing protein 59 n=1 Tax=Rhynchospora pubera TaxID=906938 RepID=A0AAV8G286_9POAL|nr:Zinc finger CCCH domain-containing protein 59 [Rhynchospora pubera]